MAFKIKRAYKKPSRTDGRRVLVDRLWPRGVRKEQTRVDEWLKDLAPSADLRKWFAHDPSRWEEFRRRYLQELQEKPDAINELRRAGRRGTVTLIYAAKDEAHNNAEALKQYLQGKS